MKFPFAINDVPAYSLRSLATARRPSRRPAVWLAVWLATLVLVLTTTLPGSGGEPGPDFRTDGGDESLPWFQLVPGEFPPAGSAHYFSGELIGMDHLERTFLLRVDRTDSQRRSHFDLPVAAAMLPYGSIDFHGAPAALRDIPIGTHLHGWFYLKAPDDDSQPPAIFHNRVSPEAEFRRCLKLQDDFSYHQQCGETWRVDAVKRKDNQLQATLLRDGEPVGESTTFDLQPSTRCWQGNRLVSAEALKAGQTVQLNLTWATLYGPGRVAEIWLDEQSRALAAAQQQRRHRQHVRERGLPGWVDAVDNPKRIVTITFFDNVDDALVDELDEGDNAGVAVARRSLMTYDPVNDRKRGRVLSVETVPKRPGSSGVQVRVQPDLLLEGYRPGRIVRVYPPSWPVIALPKEERYFGR
jgi:hypothetical protein